MASPHKGKTSATQPKSQEILLASRKILSTVSGKQTAAV